MSWDKTPLHFWIAGKPIPQERPYFGGKGRIFDRFKSKMAKQEIALTALSSMKKDKKELLIDSVIVELKFIGAHGGADLDNLVKLVLDALKGIVWKDDKQVVEIQAKKEAGKDPMTFVTIRRF